MNECKTVLVFSLKNETAGQMLGSSVLNHRQHAGLQKLSALAGVTRSSLGPNKNYKFIQDDASGESTLVCSCIRVFESLELSCAVGQLVYETVRAHDKIYHTGSGCLLFLAGAWSRAALECLQRGISVAHIISAMSEGMDVCLDVCRRSSVSIDGLGAERSESSATASNGLGHQLLKKPLVEALQAPGPKRQTTKSGPKTLKLSRHFCEAKSENVSTVLQTFGPEHPDIARIAEGLSHGRRDAMNLVIEASRIQSRTNRRDVGRSTFDVAKVATCTLPGLPEDHACVLPGFIVLLSAEQASVARHLQEQRLKVALINGDLSDTYRHLGFQRPTGVTCVCDQSDISSSSKEEEWMEKVATLLLKLEVNLILVSGLIGEKVILRCCRHRILVVEKVKVSILKEFANATGAVPVTYATQLSRHCVGTGGDVVMWRELSRRYGKPSAAVNISTGGDGELVTVVLTSCVHGKLQALEDQFWACAYRVHHVLKDQVVLPGAGVAEMLCVHHLQKRAERYVSERKGASVGAEPSPYRGVVLHLMADAIIDYISTVMVNTGRFSKVRARTAVSRLLKDFNESSGIAAKFSQILLEGEPDVGSILSPVKLSDAPALNIYDSLSVKQESWRKALDLVFLVLQADAEVITGSDQKTDTENLLLL